MEDFRKKYSLPGIECLFPIENFINFFSSDGLKLHTYKYPSVNKPRCLVYMFHGLHGYCQNHAVVAKCLAEADCEVLSVDFRGHGKSEGPPGLLTEFPELLNDNIKFIKETSTLYDNLPIFLCGGSMGGCLCIHISTKLEGMIKGIILMSPALGTTRKCQSLAYCILSCFRKCCARKLLIKPNPAEVCSNQELIEYLEENPYIYTDRVRLGTITTVMQGMKGGKGLIDSVNTPFVIVHGTDDRIVDPIWSEVMYRDAPVKDKSLWMYTGLSHSLVFEKEIYEISERIRTWVVERL